MSRDIDSEDDYVGTDCSVKAKGGLFYMYPVGVLDEFAKHIDSSFKEYWDWNMEQEGEKCGPLIIATRYILSVDIIVHFRIRSPKGPIISSYPSYDFIDAKYQSKHFKTKTAKFRENITARFMDFFTEHITELKRLSPGSPSTLKHYKFMLASLIKKAFEDEILVDIFATKENLSKEVDTLNDEGGMKETEKGCVITVCRTGFPEEFSIQLTEEEIIVRLGNEIFRSPGKDYP